MGNKILQKILKILAKRVIKKYQPMVIGITGSVGKSTTKEAVYEVLKNEFRVRKNQGNYNNEIGMPLTILGFYPSPGSLWKNILAWLKIFIRAIFNLPEKKNYPEILILEMATSHPGDIKYLLDIVRPQIGILTAIAPVHLKFFKDMADFFTEEQSLIRALPPNAWAILNEDDKLVASLKNKIKTKTLTFGFGERAMIRAIEKKEPHFEGLQFKIKYQGNIVPCFLPGLIADSQIYAALAATAVGLSLNLNLLTITNYLSSYQPLSGRMSVVRGKKNTMIIDDTYNSSPRAAKEALKTLSEIISTARKWAVLADMLELGEKSKDLHYAVGEEAAKMNFNFLLTYGPKALNIARGARAGGMEEKNIISFEQQDELIKFLEKNISPEDVILVKGSRGMKMDKIVEALKS